MFLTWDFPSLVSCRIHLYCHLKGAISTMIALHCLTIAIYHKNCPHHCVELLICTKWPQLKLCIPGFAESPGWCRWVTSCTIIIMIAMILIVMTMIIRVTLIIDHHHYHNKHYNHHHYYHQLFLSNYKQQWFSSAHRCFRLPIRSDHNFCFCWRSFSSSSPPSTHLLAFTQTNATMSH